MTFADTLEQATLDVICSGIMTKDLALLYAGNAQAVTTSAFLDAIAQRLEQH